MSPAPLSNVVVSIEVHVDWIGEMLEYMREKNLTKWEATAAAEQEWVHHANEITDQTLMRFSDSWYTGTNVPGKPRVQIVYRRRASPRSRAVPGSAHRGSAMVSGSSMAMMCRFLLIHRYVHRSRPTSPPNWR